MAFWPVKCNIMQITKMRTNKIEASYTLEGTIFKKKKDSIKYLTLTITHDLRWNTNICISNVCTMEIEHLVS